MNDVLDKQITNFLTGQGLEAKLSQSDLNGEINNFLSHHGVKGQRWGTRKINRIQGTLDRLHRLSSGKATVGDRVILANRYVFTKNQSTKALKRGADLQKAVKSGNTFATQFLTKKGQNSLQYLNYHQKK